MASVDEIMSGDIPNPTVGGNRRSINRKQDRLLSGVKRPTKRSRMLDRLPPSYNPRSQTSDQYRVKTQSSTVRGEERERNARLVLRQPSRRIPESEKPSKVVKSRVS
jgi:hypothetical protein